MAEMHQRIKEALEFAQESPVLQLGEHGLESDTGLFKIGDGVTRWNSLEYYGQTPDGAKPPIVSGSYMVVVEHGDDADTPRPEDAVIVYWYGSVEPTFALEDDLWSGEGGDTL